MKTSSMLILTALVLAIPTFAVAQSGRENVGETIRKVETTDLKKQQTFKKAWVKTGDCHERFVKNLVGATPYRARCMTGGRTTRHAGEAFNCEGRQGEIVTLTFPGGRYMVYKAKRFTCTMKDTSLPRYQLGYDPGQDGKLTANVAADYACGCYTPADEDCDRGLCRGRMQAALIDHDPDRALAALPRSLDYLSQGFSAVGSLGYLATHAFSIDWERTLFS